MGLTSLPIPTTWSRFQRSEVVFPSSAVTRLPAEILLQILTEATTPKHFYDSKHVSVSVALHVCKGWRRVAFNIPSLWRPVDVSNVTTHELELTGPLPSLLRVTCSKWTIANIRTWSTSVLEVIQRIWELELLNIPSTPVFDALSLHIDRPASELRVLRAFINVPARKPSKGRKTKAKVPPWDQMGRFMDRSMPHLRIVELNNFPILPWSPDKPPSFSNLTSLSLRMWYNSDHANFSQLVPSLKASSTSLTYLSLFNVIPDMGAEVSAGLVRLPFLKVLSITTNESDATLIARLLQIPQKTRITLSSKDVDLSSINPDDIIQIYERSYLDAPPLKRRKIGQTLSVHVSKDLITVESIPNASLSLRGCFSQTDYSAILLDLALRLCSILPSPQVANYTFGIASMDCDWSAFLRNLDYTWYLTILNIPLAPFRKFMQKCELGSFAPKLQELQINIDMQEDADSFEDEDAATDALRDAIISLRGHLRRHTQSYKSITTVGFHAESFSSDEFRRHFVDPETDFEWTLEGYSSVEGTRGWASRVKFELGGVDTDVDSDD
ncbi:hypothetical protein ONZ45_g2684 [Pleurotus djamor]|nr:hypothetical protein ONZ45_g2684 [Pleurotus djamor]